MLLPDEITTQTTDVLERLPRSLDRRSAEYGKRQHLSEQKQTDALPPLEFDLSTPGAKIAWRQVTQLRKENRHLHARLSVLRGELQQAATQYAHLKEEHEKEIAIIHNGHRQEINHYQAHLQEIMAERNQLQDSYIELQQRYQELVRSFQDAIEQAAHEMVTAAAETAVQSPDKVPILLQDVVKTVELQVRQKEDKHLIETLHLKRGVLRMIDLLEQERKQLSVERQQLCALQWSIREQGELRQKTLRMRLHAHWKLASVLTSFGLLLLLVVLQFVFLALLRVHLFALISFSLLAPVVVCALLALVLATPMHMLKFMLRSAPYKKKVE